MFGNKTSADIILEHELKEMLGDNFNNILSDEEHCQYQTGFISRELIVDQLTTPGMKVDVCGPPPMMESVLDYLSELETPKESIVTEEF